MWYFCGSDNVDEATDQLESIDSSLSNLPLAVQARILEPHELIEDCNVPDKAVIVIEPKITFNLNDKV